jgi:restriction system protein
MAVWLIRAGKYGEDESIALNSRIAIIGWEEVPDISRITTRENLEIVLRKSYPEMSPNAVKNWTSQLWAFKGRVKKGDIVVLPLKTRSAIAIGEVTGDYENRDGRHVRNVNWVRTDVPRSDVGQDLLYSLGAFMTVCQIQRNNAEERFKTIMIGGKDPNLGLGIRKRQDITASDAEPDELIMVDLEEQSYDQIRNLIESRFKGHKLAVLVEEVLKAKGYHTYRSPEGPDGGIDILAGYGPMGFENPKICVQVKSGGIQNDSAIRELEGVMSRIGATQGLFVSWDGFNKTALDNAHKLFFKLRIWDARTLISSLLDIYDKLPDQIQAELPLKRIWIVVPEEG